MHAPGAPSGTDKNPARSAPGTDSSFALRWDEVSSAQLAEILVHEHFAALYRFCFAMGSDSETAHQVTLAALLLGLQKRYQYQGQTRVRAWLLGFACHELRHKKRSRQRPDRGKIPPALRRVNLRDRAIVGLSILEDFSGVEIAFCLSIKESLVERRLDRLSRAADSSLAETLRQRALHASEKEPELLTLALTELSESAAQVEHPHPLRSPLRAELGWVLVLLAIGAGILFMLREQLLAESGPGLFPTPTPPLPTAVMIEDMRDREPTPTDATFVESNEPAVSRDALFIAFSSVDALLVPGDTNQIRDIFVLDRLDQIFERVSVSSEGEQADGSSSSPSISANGRWIAFVSDAGNLTADNHPACQSRRGGWTVNCEDIFVHDRRTGRTELISRGTAGGAGDGHSRYPAISADGRWVVFWSSAGNLTADDGADCPAHHGGQSCLDVFIHDRGDGTISRIPIGRSTTYSAALARLSISADGSKLLLPVWSDDRIAADLELANRMDVFLYDREEASFELINRASSGESGNAPSFGAELSASGDQVVFASEADNLVAEDTNRLADIFVRDLRSGTTERVSVGSDGVQSNGPSGTIDADTGSIGLESSISATGRFVAFISTATNLDPQGLACDIPSIVFTCSSIYLHDRETGQTRVVASPIGGSQLQRSPRISQEGGWVTYLEQTIDCRRICAAIYLYHIGSREAQPVSIPTQIAEPSSLLWSQQALLRGHEGWVNALDISADGMLLATGANDGKIKLWQMPEGRALYTLSGHTRSVTQMVFSPNWNRESNQFILASGANDGTVILWQVSKVSGTWRFRLDDHPGGVRALAFSPDGKRLAVGHQEGIWIWEMRSRTALLVDRYEHGPVGALAYWPAAARETGADLLAAAMTDNAIWLFEGPQVVMRLGGHSRPVISLAFSPSGEMLASGSEDERVLIWTLRKLAGSQQIVADVEQTLWHEDRIRSVTFSPDGTYLAVGAEDDSLQIWDLSRGEQVQFPFRWPRYRIFSVAFSPDGQSIAAGATVGLIHLLQVPQSEQAAEQPAPVVPEQQVLRYFSRAAWDHFQQEQVILLDGPEIDLATISQPPATNYPLSTPDLSPWSSISASPGTSVPRPSNIPGRAVFMADLSTGFRMVSTIYDYPVSPLQHIRILVHFPSGLGDAVLREEDFPSMQVGASAQVVPIDLNGTRSELVRGGWVYSVREEPFVSPEGHYAIAKWNVDWDPQLTRMALRWQNGGALYEIVVFPKPGYQIVAELPSWNLLDLLQTAEAMLEEGASR